MWQSRQVLVQRALAFYSEVLRGIRAIVPRFAEAMTFLRGWPREVLQLLVMTAVVFSARASFADHYRVPSGSMEPTVQVGDQICVNKLAFGLRIPASESYLVRGAEPERGEVVVFTSPDSGEVLLKRLVALPGDRVQVERGRLIINEQPVPIHADESGVVEELAQHPHLLGTAFGGGPDFGAVTVPADHYLMLGDNRGNSRDGRFFGWVERKALLGRAAAICVREGRPVWKAL
jgi:signal peptidase I